MSESQVLLLVLCGLPGSGKSTFVQRMREELANVNSSPSSFHPLRLHAISFDSIYEQLQRTYQQHHQAQPTSQPSSDSAAAASQSFPFLWHTSRQVAYQLTEEIIRRTLKKETSQGSHEPLSSLSSATSSCNSFPERHIILLDDNFFYRSMRYTYYQLARQQRIAYLQLQLQCGLEEAIQRNELRNQMKARHKENQEHLPGSMDPSDQDYLNHLISCALSHPVQISSTSNQLMPPLDFASLDQSSEVTESTIRKMAAQFQPPIPISSVATSFDSNDTSGVATTDSPNHHRPRWERDHSHLVRSDSIPWSLIHGAFSHDVPEPPIDPILAAQQLTEARTRTLQSMVHQLDLQTRRILNQRISTMKEDSTSVTSPTSTTSINSAIHAPIASSVIPPALLAQVARRWNDQRKQFLVQLKQPNTDLYRQLHACTETQVEEEVMNGAELVRESSSNSTTAETSTSRLPSTLENLLKQFEASLKIDYRPIC